MSNVLRVTTEINAPPEAVRAKVNCPFPGRNAPSAQAKAVFKVQMPNKPQFLDFAALPSYSKFFESVTSPKPGMELQKGDKVTVKIANSPVFPGKIEVSPPTPSFFATQTCSQSSASIAPARLDLDTPFLVPSPNQRAYRLPSQIFRHYVLSIFFPHSATSPTPHLTRPRRTRPKSSPGPAPSPSYSPARTHSTGRRRKRRPAARRLCRKRCSRACWGDCMGMGRSRGVWA